MSSSNGSGGRSNTRKSTSPPYKTVSEARVGIGRYLTFYNSRRPNSSLDRQTPDQAYFNALTPMMVAA